MAWGDDEYGQLGDGTKPRATFQWTVEGLHEVTAIAAGLYYSWPY